jgi:hypothetical protein
MANDPRESDTVRDLPRAKPQVRDTLPEQVGVYVAPRPLAPTSDHRTMQIKPVLIAPHLDPRRAPTELRMMAPPPPRRRLRYLIPLALFAVALGAVLATQLTGDLGRGSPPDAQEPTPVSEAKPANPAAAPPPRAAGETANGRVTPAAPAGAQAPAPPSASAAPRKKPRDPWLD